MENFFDYISDAAIKCKIVQREDTGKTDLVTIYANKQTEVITNVPNSYIIDNNLTDVFPLMSNAIFDWPKIISEAAMTNDSKIIEQYFVAFEKYLKLNIFGYKDGYLDIIITDLTEKREMKRSTLERDRQIKHLENELKYRANVDKLTNTYNYQFLTDSIENSIESYKEEGANFCVLLLDIDKFKQINQTLGIRMGDLILQELARSISLVTRKIDVTGRYGNDEFMVILNNIDIDIAKIMVDKLIQEIEKYFIKMKGKNVTVSGVLVEYNKETVEELLDNIETKMKKAKSMGTGTII